MQALDICGFQTKQPHIILMLFMLYKYAVLSGKDPGLEKVKDSDLKKAWGEFNVSGTSHLCPKDRTSGKYAPL